MSVPSRVVVLGGTGMLGTELVAVLGRAAVNAVAPGRETLDLMDPGAAAEGLARLEPEWVINASAYTDVARAELPEERDAVDALNRDAPGALALACRDLGARFVHVSTDYVFDGARSEPYREADAVAPLQVYGLSKLEGERLVLDAYPEALVARTSTLYGAAPRLRRHYVDAILAQAAERERIDVVRAPVSSPTFAPDLAEALVALAGTDASGIVHSTNAGGCSRLELARAAVRLAGFGDRVRVEEREEPPGTLRRPAYSVLSTERQALLIGPPRPWEEALADYVRVRGG